MELKINIVDNNEPNSHDSFESYIKEQIKQGYLSEKDLAPLKCHHCDSENLKDKNHLYENLGCSSFDRYCNDCGKLVNCWSYGCWDV